MLKKYVLFIWDEQAQRSFDAVKTALMSTSVLSPPNYTREIFLYLVATESTSGMVLVQEDDSSREHVIHYHSKVLVGPEFRYSLATIHVVQRLKHYILRRKMTIVVIMNPIRHILSR